MTQSTKTVLSSAEVMQYALTFSYRVYKGSYGKLSTSALSSTAPNEERLA
jgi:hypothetical protein